MSKKTDNYTHYCESRMNALVFEKPPITTRFRRLFCLLKGVFLGSLRAGALGWVFYRFNKALKK